MRVGGALISRKPTGFLACSKCRDSIGCEHIRRVIAEHADFGLLASPDAELTSTTIMVPIVLDKHLWAEVRVGSRHEATQTYGLQLIGRRRGESPSIGFLERGEGRLVMRSMILSWFMGNVPLDMLRCEAYSHGFKQELAWVKVLQGGDPKALLAEQWSIWYDGSCLTCRAGSMEDFDDLVPEVTASKTMPSPW